MPRPMLCVAAAGLFLSAMPAQAQSLETLDAANGERLARALCINCHQVAPDGAGTVIVDVPGFAAVANRPGMTREAIEAYVLTPHPAMPEIQVTRDELADIAAYIMSLRQQ